MLFVTPKEYLYRIDVYKLKEREIQSLCHECFVCVCVGVNVLSILHTDFHNNPSYTFTYSFHSRYCTTLIHSTAFSLCLCLLLAAIPISSVEEEEEKKEEKSLLTNMSTERICRLHSMNTFLYSFVLFVYTLYDT